MTEGSAKLATQSGEFFLLPCSWTAQPHSHVLPERLDDRFLASFVSEPGFPDVHGASQQADLNQAARFSP